MSTVGEGSLAPFHLLSPGGLLQRPAWTRISTGYRHDCPCPPGGGGGARSAGGVGARQVAPSMGMGRPPHTSSAHVRFRSHCAPSLLGAPPLLLLEHRTHLSPPLVRLTATVHCMGTSPGRNRFRAIPASERPSPGNKPDPAPAHQGKDKHQTGSGSSESMRDAPEKESNAGRGLL
jgi:hypothetical protein